MTVCADNSCTEVIAETMANVSTNSRDVESLYGSVGEEAQDVLLPFYERCVLVYSQGD